ncbi:MAG: glutaredoxin 3 [Gammaproteobacteria bacterium]|nr:glutaredoxin 3 [Gammaproteobacteria bacterium]
MSSNPRIEIYTTPFCPYCWRAKALLESRNLPFEEFDVARDRSLRKEMVERAGGRTTVPQIFIGNSHIGGCDDLYELEIAGKLDGVLEANGIEA